MKNVFGYEVLGKKDLSDMGGSAFIIRKIDEEQLEENKKAKEVYDALGDTVKLPLWAAVLQPLSILSFLPILFYILYLFGAIELGDDSNSSLIVVIISIPFGIFYIVSKLWEKRKIKNVDSNQEFVDDVQYLNKIAATSFNMLGIPDSCFQIDVLVTRYKRKKDTYKLASMGPFLFLNEPRNIFIENDMICFGSINEVLGIPRASVRSIKKVKKSAVIPQWNKDIPFKKEPYKLKSNQFGVMLKYHYQIDILHNSIEYQLLIPSYDIDEFIKLTGLTVDITEE